MLPSDTACILQDAACEEVDYNIQTSSSDDLSDEEEEEAVEEERRKQLAVLEKEKVREGGERERAWWACD